MTTTLTIRNIFHLADGRTIFACVGNELLGSLAGRQAIIANGHKRQTITLSGECTMLNRNTQDNQHALETRDDVALTLEDAQSGTYQMILD